MNDLRRFVAAMRQITGKRFACSELIGVGMNVRQEN